MLNFLVIPTRLSQSYLIGQVAFALAGGARAVGERRRERVGLVHVAMVSDQPDPARCVDVHAGQPELALHGSLYDANALDPGQWYDHEVPGEHALARGHDLAGEPGAVVRPGDRREP